MSVDTCRPRGVGGAVEVTLGLAIVEPVLRPRASAEGRPISEDIRAGISTLVRGSGASSRRGGSTGLFPGLTSPSLCFLCGEPPMPKP